MATKTETTILDEIASFLERFLVFQDAMYSRIIALWILHTWTFGEFFPMRPWVTPYLYIWSKTPRAGKSTVIRVARALCLNPEVSGDITSAALFKLIESEHPTLLIDEVDTVFNGSGEGNESFRRSLNTGYEASGTATRGVGKEVQKYSTFCAKLLAGINSLDSDLPETVRTRSIPVELVTAHPKERFYAHKAGPEAMLLAEKIDAWIRSHGEAIISYEPELIESMDPRAFEISFPLLQLAHALGVEAEIRTALIRMLAPPLPKDEPHVALLRQIREVFDEKGRDKVHTAEILEKLGDSWNGHLLKSRIKPYVVGDAENFRVNGKGGRGYRRAQFADAFARFLG